MIERRKACGGCCKARPESRTRYYEAQKVLLQKVDAEEIPMKELFKRGRDMLDLIVDEKDPMEPPAE